MTSLTLDAANDVVPRLFGVTRPLRQAYFAALGFDGPDLETEALRLLWAHATAVAFSPAARAGDADAVWQGRPRTPLPNRRDILLASAALGSRVADLLNTESPLPGVTTGDIPARLRAIASVSRVGCGGLDAPHLSLTAGCNRAEERPFLKEERDALGEKTAARLGGRTRDVYLNDAAYWKNVPERVWTYTIGGYQVLKKWLSYREAPLLGRPLTVDEAREVRAIVRRLAALVLMEPELDASYRAVASDAFPWPDGGA